MDQQEQKKTAEDLRRDTQEQRASAGYGIPTSPEELKKIVYGADKKKEWAMVQELRRRGWGVKRLPDKECLTYIHCKLCEAKFELFREKGYDGTFSFCPFCGKQVKTPDGKIHVVREVVEGGEDG